MAYNVAAILELPPTPATATTAAASAFNTNANFPSFALHKHHHHQPSSEITTITPSIQSAHKLDLWIRFYIFLPSSNSTHFTNLNIGILWARSIWAVTWTWRRSPWPLATPSTIRRGSRPWSCASDSRGLRRLSSRRAKWCAQALNRRLSRSWRLESMHALCRN